MDKNSNNVEKNDEISIMEIFEVLWSKIVWIIAAALICGAAAFGAAKLFMPLEYQSYTSMYVKNSNAAQTESVNLNDLNASKSLVSTYIAVLQDDAVMEEVSRRIAENHSEEELSAVFAMADGKPTVGSVRSCITMSSVNETEVLRVTAITKNAEISAELCNTIAEIAPEFIVRVIGASSVEAIGEAKVFNAPVAPNIPKYTALGLAGGAALAVCVILVMYFLDNTVKSSDELDKRFRMPIIGEIQDFSSGKSKKEKKKNSIEEKRVTLLDKNVPFYVTEAYKAMRTNIVFSLSTYDKKIFAVSSANPGEGKSTTAANISIALAQAEHKVLLIDGDLRKPVQHKIFGIKNQKGFSGLISKMNKLEECIQKNVTENLDVLTSGPKPPNPSELMASGQTAKILEQLSEKYDYIIIDTPPVNVVSDAMGISNSISGILLVLRYGSTTFEDTESAMKKIELADMNLLGFILNDINKKNGSGYGYKYKYKSGYSDYSYGYGYGEEKKEDEKK